MDGYFAGAQVGDPYFGYAGLGVAGQLRAAVVGQCAVGDLDDEAHIRRCQPS